MITVDQLVRRIDITEYKGPGSGTYLFDPSTYEIVPKRLFGNSTLQAYEVITSGTGAFASSGTLEAVTGAGGPAGSWQLYIDYKASIHPSKVTDVLRACAAATSLRPVGEHLMQAVIRVTQQLADRSPRVFEQQDPETIEALQRQIEQQFLRDYGVNISILLRTGGEASASTISADVSTPTADFSTPIQLRAYAETFVRSHERQDAQLALAAHPATFLQKLVQQAARETMSEVTTAQLRLEIDGEVTRRLKIRIEELLAAYYVRVRTVRLALDEPLRAPPAGQEVEMVLQRSLRDYPEPVILHSQLHFQLVEEGTYWEAGAPALEAWVKVEAQRAISLALHGATYSQLCLESQRWESHIGSLLQAAARKIGYELTFEIRLPRLDSNQHLEPFLLEIEDGFATAATELPAQLMVAVRVQLDSFDVVRGAIDRGEDLRQAFKATIREEIAAYLHTLQPIHLFLSLRQPYPAQPVGAEGSSPIATVESVLRDRIEQALKRRFDLRTLSFTLKLGSSSLGDLYGSLMNAQAIDFEVNACLSGHTAAVEHSGSLEVCAVQPEDWSLFQRKRPTLEQVAAAATRAMSTLVDQHTDSQRFGLSPGELRDLAYNRLPEELRKQLGITVACIGWRRALGADDLSWQGHHDQLRELHLETLLLEQKVLQKQLTELLSRQRSALLAGDLEDAKQLDLQLRELQRQGKLTTGSLPSLLPEPLATTGGDENWREAPERASRSAQSFTPPADTAR